MGISIQTSPALINGHGDEVQPLLNRAIVIKKRLSLLQKALCNDDMFVLCHHGVIHSAQLEGKTAV